MCIVCVCVCPCIHAFVGVSVCTVCPSLISFCMNCKPGHTLSWMCALPLLHSSVTGAFRAMKVWFTGEEEGEEREGSASQQERSLPGNSGNFHQALSRSEGSALFHEDSVLPCGDGDVPSPPLVSLLTGRHSSDRSINDSDTACQSWTARTPLLDQVSISVRSYTGNAVYVHMKIGV